MDHFWFIGRSAHYRKANRVGKKEKGKQKDFHFLTSIKLYGSRNEREREKKKERERERKRYFEYLLTLILTGGHK